ncbi:MAG: type IV pilus modification protein PilV [Zoogloeaceae bacterium]|nr:type IV pilus modification protein PilV [Zoogloeaceae bacterium]
MHSQSSRQRRQSGQSGFTLLEALVTMFIFALGLLGLLGLQSRTLKLNQAAMARTVASQHVYAILDEMRVNWKLAREGQYNIPKLVPIETAAAEQPEKEEKEETEETGQQRYHIWAKQLQAALPDSKVQICRRKDAIATSVESLTEESECNGNTDNDYFVVRVDWSGGLSAGSEDDSKEYQSVKAVAYIPETH